MFVENISFVSGMSIQHFSSFPDIANVDSRIYRQELTPSDLNKRFSILQSYNFKIGYDFSNKNKLIQANIFINYVPKALSSGNFRFYELQKPNYGTIEQKINNIGVSFIFGIGKSG